MNALLWVTLACLPIGQENTAAAADEKPTYFLRESAEVGLQVRSKVHLVIQGEVTLGENTEKLSGQALLEYPERILSVTEDGLPKQVLRYYSDARAKFVVGSASDGRQLRPGFRLLVGEHGQKGFELWSPSGPLLTPERELIEDVMNTTWLSGLMKAEEAAEGDVWDADARFVASVCDFDELMQAEVDETGKANPVQNTIRCTLSQVANEQAVVVVEGTVQGLSAGAVVKARIAAQMLVNLRDKMITKVVWRQSEVRSASPVAPAGQYQVAVNIDRERMVSPYLTDEVATQVAAQVNPAAKLLAYEDPQGRYRLYHPRGWHMTVVRPNVISMRKMDGSTFRAQMNVTTMAQGSRVDGNNFLKMLTGDSDLDARQILVTREVPNIGKFNVQCFTSEGTQDQIELVNRHYLCTNRDGRQIVISFVMEPENADPFGNEDLQIVGAFEFTDRVAATATAGDVQR